MAVMQYGMAGKGWGEGKDRGMGRGRGRLGRSVPRSGQLAYRHGGACGCRAAAGTRRAR